MWELNQITSQLGIKDSHAVHTVTLALQVKFCRNSWNIGVRGFQLLLRKAKAPWHGLTPAQHVVTSAKGLLDHSNGLPGKAQVDAGKKAKDFCQCKSVLRATKVPQPAEPVVPGALYTLGSISSPFWPSQEIPVDIHVMYPELHQHHCHKLFSSGNHQHSGNL